MSKWLTDQEPIFICPRCGFKRKYSQQVSDPNTHVIVCDQGCSDLFDPYRLPARQTEKISLQHPRPDEDIST